MRAQVTGVSTVGTPRGLTLFMLRGLVAWMNTWRGLRSQPGPVPIRAAEPVAALAPTSELASLLADIAMFHESVLAPLAFEILGYLYQSGLPDVLATTVTGTSCSTSVLWSMLSLATPTGYTTPASSTTACCSLMVPLRPSRSRSLKWLGLLEAVLVEDEGVGHQPAGG
jgi:hypothetical protein